MVFRYSAFAITLIIVAMVAACGSHERARLPQDRMLRLADAEAKGLDPQKYSDLTSLRIASEQFEGLTRYDGTGKAVPGLASSWTTSSDGLHWRFILRDGLRFSDGTPISADIFTRMFRRLNSVATASPHRSLFAMIKEVRQGGPLEVQITLRQPVPSLPSLLAHPAMAALPLHRIAVRGDRWVADRPMVASGPYRLVSWALNDRIKLEANPNWHDGKPFVHNVDWIPVDDNFTALRLFRAGVADTTSDFPPSRIQWLKRNFPEAIHVEPYYGAYYFAFNTRKPPFNDVRVRRALSLAINREWIAGPLLNIGNLPAWGIIPPGIDGLASFHPSWADQTQASRLATARHLLRSAGYGPKRPLRFEIRFNSDTDHRRVAVALSAMWKPLGVEPTLLNSEAALHFAALRAGDFQLARSGWIADLQAGENFLAIHRSNAGFINYSGYANPAFDRAIDTAMSETNLRLRSGKMRTAERILIHDAPILPIYFYISRALISSRIVGWRDNPGNIHPSYTLRLQQGR